MKLYIDGEQHLANYGIKFISELSAAFKHVWVLGLTRRDITTLSDCFTMLGSPQTLNTGLLLHNCLKWLLHFTVPQFK